MAKKLSQMGWADIKAELSMTVDPQKFEDVFNDIKAIIIGRINTNSIPDVESMQFILKVITAELKVWERIQRNRQHPKI